MEQTLAEKPLETTQARSFEKNDKLPAEGFQPLKTPDFSPKTTAATYVSSAKSSAPCWQREERRGRDLIIIAVFGGNSGYTFAAQAKLGSLVRAVYPHQIEKKYPTLYAARDAAILQLHEWTKAAPRAKARLKAFDLSLCSQRELFQELESQA